MIDDPIVEEVRATRQRLLDEAGGNLRTLMERIRAARPRELEELVTAESVRELSRKSVRGDT